MGLSVTGATGATGDGITAGAITMFAGSSAPSGYLLCDGTAVSRVTYATLFTVTSTTYGAGDGVTTFNVPDLRTRVPVGKNATGTFATLGATGGAETVTLTSAEIPAHTHSTPALSGTFTSGAMSANADHSHANSVASTAYERNAGVPAGSGSLYYTRNSNANGGTQGLAPGTTITNASANIAHTHDTAVSFAANTSGSTGSGGAHNNLQPYIVLNYIIKT
jgi:microcystin-dependent protein